jgi:FkbM family methyltransferase
MAVGPLGDQMNFIKSLVSRLHEKSLYRKLRRMDLPENGIVIDCGANIGNFTAVFASRPVKVYSFEPNSSAYSVLQNRFQRNPNVTLVKKAVWIENTELQLFHHVKSSEDEVKWSTGSSLIVEKGNVSKEKFESVEAVDLSHFIKSLNQRVNLLKIDIEGAEVEVVNKLIDDETYLMCDQILVETHPKILTRKAGLEKLRLRVDGLKIKNIDLDWI